jgi:hypothetical protein
MVEDDTGSEGPSTLEHLLPWARTYALLPTAKRIQHLRADRWIGYSRANALLAKLEALYTHPVRQRMPNLLIVGPTNNGKTMIVEKFRRQHHSPSVPHAETEVWPIISMQMPSGPTVTRFYAQLLETLHVPMRSYARLPELETLALRTLRAVRARLLVIDELHNMLAGPRAAQREFLNLLRFLGNELRIPIVCLGTKEAYYAISGDDQLENRFEPVGLPLWQDDAELASLLASFGAVLPLRHCSQLDDPDITRYILDQSEGTIGEIATLLTSAAMYAIERGVELIDRRVLAAADYRSPSVRRSTVQRIVQ